MADKKSRIDQDLVRDLANILTETDLTEIEVEQDDLRIKVSRGGAVLQTVAPQSQPVGVSAAQAATPHSAADSTGEAPSGLKNAVTSPMVGTAYLAPSPEADPFVQVGQAVTEGQPVLIIEAMKTMNQIPAPRDGKVTAILVEDAQPVEFGEPLLIVE